VGVGAWPLHRLPRAGRLSCALLVALAWSRRRRRLGEAGHPLTFAPGGCAGEGGHGRMPAVAAFCPGAGRHPRTKHGAGAPSFALGCRGAGAPTARLPASGPLAFRRPSSAGIWALGICLVLVAPFRWPSGYRLSGSHALWWRCSSQWWRSSGA
jgi:hypothetical protein